MICIYCYRGISDGVTLFRQNPKGEEGIWACEACNFKSVDPQVREIVDLINPPAPERTND